MLDFGFDTPRKGNANVRSLLGIAVCLCAAACGPSPADDAQPSADPADAAPAAAPIAAGPDDVGPDDPPAATVGGDSNVLVDLLEQDIPYGEGPSGNLVGFLAVPADAAEPLPGVIVLHEW